jgi:hypothetical protein
MYKTIGINNNRPHFLHFSLFFEKHKNKMANKVEKISILFIVIGNNIYIIYIKLLIY